jgi:hypothetical protein
MMSWFLALVCRTRKIATKISSDVRIQVKKSFLFRKKA